MPKTKLKFVVLLGICTFLIYSILILNGRSADHLLPKDVHIDKRAAETHPLLACYGTMPMAGSADQHWLGDILKETRQPQLGRTIFFHVTNCLNGSIELNNRQACTIESAAKSNPEWDVFILFAYRVTFPDHMSLATGKLMIYPNIHWRHVNLWTYANNTPAQEWIHDESQLLNSTYFVVHASDFLRLVSLFRYGGTHLDLDFIMKKSISDLDSNYACAESDHMVGNAVLNFDHTGFGHEFVAYILREFVHNYDGTSWGKNGPELMTRILQKKCNATITPRMNRKRCNFNVLPQKSFFAVYPYWRKLFDEVHAAEVARLTKESIGIHFWNSLTNVLRIRTGSSKPTAYEILAKEFCPSVYDSIDEYF